MTHSSQTALEEMKPIVAWTGKPFMLVTGVQQGALIPMAYASGEVKEEKLKWKLCKSHLLLFTLLLLKHAFTNTHMRMHNKMQRDHQLTHAVR